MNVKKIFLVVLFFSEMLAEVQYADYWKLHSKTSDASMPSKLYVLHDVHDLSFTKKNIKEKKVIFDFIRQTKSSLIIESPEQEDVAHSSLYQLFKNKDLLHYSFRYLSLLAEYENIITANVDFRSRNKEIEAIKERTDKKIEEILSYSDHSLLTEHYRKVIKAHQEIIAPLYHYVYSNRHNLALPKVQEKAQLLVNKYRPDLKVEEWDKKELIEYLATCYNTEIVDLEVLHAICGHGKRGVDSVVVYIGMAHANRIKGMLATLGYRKVNYIKLIDSSGRLWSLPEGLQIMDPAYDYYRDQTKNSVDRLLDYLEWKENHPTLDKLIPASLCLSVVGVVGCFIAALIRGG